MCPPPSISQETFLVLTSENGEHFGLKNKSSELEKSHADLSSNGVSDCHHWVHGGIKIETDKGRWKK